MPRTSGSKFNFQLQDALNVKNVYKKKLEYLMMKLRKKNKEKGGRKLELEVECEKM